MSLSASLWKTWIKTVKLDPEAVAVIEADTGLCLTRKQLTKLAETFHTDNLQGSKNRTVVLCFTNTSLWLIAFLAVQKGAGSAVLLDASTPDQEQFNWAHKLKAQWLISETLGNQLIGLKKKAQKISVIKISSGSTDQPKEIRCPAHHLLADGKAIIKGMKILPSDRNLALIPLSHSYAVGNVVMPLILQGTASVLAKAFIPSQIPLWIKKHQVTVFPSVPVIYRILTQIKPKPSLASLRLAISAGAHLPQDTAAEFYKQYGLDIHNFYGSTETGGICYDRKGDLTRMDIGVGQALPGVGVLISASGRITVQSDAVLTPSKKFRLSDRGFWVNRNTLKLTGRCDALANIGGKKVNPEEIRTLLQKISGVGEAWVGVLHLQKRDIIVAAIETNLSALFLETKLTSLIAPWKIPRLFYCVKMLPRTSRGKIDLIRLKQVMASKFSVLK